MAETVDTRVVEAKFDSKQFEQGVDKTVKKLDELKKSLSLANTGKTVAEIGDKISETTDKATNSLQKLENRLTSFTGMLKQKLISGIADEIVGVFFKIKSGFENMVKSLSTAQIGVGMQRYTDILTSVRTLTAAGVQQDKAYEAIERLGLYADQTSYSLDSMVATMSKLKTAGADVDTATRMVEGLSNAAASMGVNAQQAERAYLNLQQAYSKKVMLQNDWMSFESIPMVGSNFNKAILKAAEKVGTLQAEKVDKKTGEVLSYKTKKKAGTKVRSAKGITADNMGSMLNSRWFTDEVMEEVFGNTYYFNEIGIDEVNKLKEQEKQIRSEVQKMVDKGELDGSKFEETVSNKLQEYFDETNKEKIEAKKKEIDLRKETAKQELEAKKLTKQEYDNLIKELDKEMQNFEAENTLTAFAYEAFRAGQEARSFTDVINTLKDAISRGWAKSFELIFGKLDEAADFFTKLTESNFAEFIYSIGEFRNAVLESWRTHGGRDNMIGVLEYLDELAGDINKQLGLVRDAEEWFEANFDSQLYTQLLRSEGKGAAEEYKESVKKESEKSPFASIAEDLGFRLAIAGRDIKDFFESVRKWFTEADTKGVSRLQRISNIIDGFGKIFNGTMTAVGMGLEFVGKMYNTFKPVFDSLWAAFEKVLTPIFNAFDPKNIRQDGMQPYNMLSNTLDNIAKVAEKVAEPLAKVIDILGDVGAFFVNLAVDSFLSNMQFFTDAFALLLEILGIGSAQQDQGAGVLDGIRKGFEEFGETVKTWGTAISDFFSSIIADIRTWLGLNDDAKNTSSGNIFQNITNWWNTNEALQNIRKKLDDFIIQVGDWIKDLPKNISQFAIDIGDFFKSLFYHKETVTNGTTTETKWIENDITLWVKQAVKDIKEWFADIPSRIKEFGIDISDFFHNLFYTKKHDIITTPKGISKMISWEVETPLKQWLDQAILDVKAFIKSIPEKITKIPSLIKEFFKNIFYTKKKVEFTTPKGIEKTAYVYVKTPLKEWLDKAILNVKEFIKSIPSKIAKIPSLIGEFFHGLFYKKETINTGSGTEEKEIATPLKEWIDGAIKDVSTWVSSIDLSGILNGIKDIGRDIVNGIISIFSGKTEWEENKNWLSERVASAIDNIRTRAEQIWPRVSEWFVDLPNKIVRFFSGEDGTKNESTPIGTAFNNFIKSIGEWLSSIPSTLLGFWKNVEAGMDSLWDKVISSITGSPRKKEVLKPNSKYYDLNKMLEEDREAGNTPSNKILSNISSFFTDLVDYIWKKIQAIPGDLKALWDKAVTIGTIVWEVITGNNTNEFGEPKNYGNDLYNNIATFVQTVSDWIGERIQDLGVLLRENWTKVKKIGTIIWETITGDNKTATGDIKDYGEGYNDAANVIEAIINWIKEQILLIPARVTAGFNFVSELVTALFNPDAAQQKSYSKYFSGHAYDLMKTDAQNAAEGAKEFLLGLVDESDKWLKDSGVNIGGTASETVRGVLDSSNAGLSITGQSLKKTGFFGELWEAFSQMFSDIGPAILEGLRKAFEWINTKLGEATTFLNGLVENKMSISEALNQNLEDSEKPGTENPMWTTIKQIGQTIFDMITKTIPNFIVSGGKYIAEHFSEWISSAFGGNKNQQKEVAEAVAEELGGFDQKQYEAIWNQNPEAAEIYKNSFINKEKNEGFNEQEYDRILQEQGKEAAEKYKEDSQKYLLLPMEDATEELAEQLPGLMDILGSLASGLFGVSSASAEGSNDLSGGGAAHSFDLFAGTFEHIQKMFSDIASNDVLKWIAIIGVVAYFLKTLSDLVDNVQFIDDIGYAAKWIGIGSMVTAIAGILSYMVILSASAEKGSKEEKKLERVKTVINDFVQILKDILTPITWIVGLLSVKSIAETIKELHDNNGTHNNTINYSRGERIAKNILTPVNSLFEGLAGGLGNTIGKTAGIYFSGGMIGDLIEKLSGNVNDSFGQLGSGVEQIATSLSTAVTKLQDMKQNNSILVAIESIKDIKTLFSEMLGLFHVLDKEINEQDKSSEDKIDNDKELQEKGKSILIIVEQLSRIFSKISGALALLKNAVSGYGDDMTLVTAALKDILGMTKEMKDFADFSVDQKFKDFKKALASLGAIFRLYSEASGKTFEEPVKKLNIDNAVDMIKQLFENEKFKELINSFSTSGFTGVDDKMLDASEKILIFASALLSIAKASKEFTGDEATNINKLFDVVNGIKPPDGKKISDLSENFGELGNAIGTFATEVSGLTTESVSNAERAITMLLRIAVGLNNIPDTSFLFTMFQGDKSLGTFGQNIMELGQNMGHFFNSIERIDEKSGIGKTIDKDVLSMVFATLDILTSIAIRMDTEVNDSFGALTKYDKKDFEKVADNALGFLQVIANFSKSEETLEKYTSEDFEYMDNILDMFNGILYVAQQIDKIEIKHTDLLSDGLNSQLFKYVETIISGANSIAGNIIARGASFTNIHDYKDKLKTYFDILITTMEMMNIAQGLGVNRDKVLEGWNLMSAAIFGYNDMHDQATQGTHHEGLLDQVGGWFDSLSTLAGKVEGHEDAIALFRDMAKMITSFMEAISQMSIAEQLSEMVHYYNVDYGEYVTNIGSVLRAMLDQRAVFKEFFDWAGEFDQSGVENAALMMDTINQVIQMMQALYQNGSFADFQYQAFSKLENIQWSRLFSIIQDTVVGDNKDFFSPKITPVLDLNDEFIANAEKMRNMLGFTEGEDGKWVLSPDLNIAEGLQIPEPKDYTYELKMIEDRMDRLVSISDNFENALSRMSFVIPAESLTATIGPSMDKWLGSEATFVVRANVNNGG